MGEWLPNRGRVRACSNLRIGVTTRAVIFEIRLSEAVRRAASLSRRRRKFVFAVVESLRYAVRVFFEKPAFSL